MERIVRYKFLLIFSVIVFVSLYKPITVKAIADSLKNREFILAFLPNYHQYWYSRFSHVIKRDSVFIYICATETTNGTIDFNDVNGNRFTENFSISNPNKLYVFKQAAFDYALRGYNLSGVLINNSHCEKAVDLSFRVKSDKPIQVYGHSHAHISGESFSVFPKESLGNEYYILSYNANIEVIYRSGDSTLDGRTPSQFAIVAAEDNTVVTIDPKVSTRYNGKSRQIINLNSGQVYLVQSTVEGPEINPDLSGTYIQSNKPIAVFSGQQMTRVPVQIRTDRASRDYIVEQLPPVDSWYNDAIIIPYMKGKTSESSQIANDKYRIIAAYDSTKVYAYDSLIVVLNKAEFFEGNLSSPLHLTANMPIMVTAYKRSSGITYDQFDGDPFIQYIPSPNQYSDNYAFVSIPSYYPYNPLIDTSKKSSFVYKEHNVIIITKSDPSQVITLDGAKITTSFSTIKGSDYLYSNIVVSNGIHKISGVKPFGLLVYGFGGSNGYGYSCGTISKRYDYDPPELQSTIECFEAEGSVTDNKLSSVTLPTDFMQNVNVNIEPVLPKTINVNYKAELLNCYLDGTFRIIAVDSINQQSSEDIEIPGFTVTVLSDFSYDDTVNIEKLSDSLTIIEKRCYSYTLKNYGQHSQTITNSMFLNSFPEITTDLPKNFELLPQQELKFQICCEPLQNDSLRDSLKITSECGERILLDMEFFVEKDKNEPQVSSVKFPCNQSFEIFITDSARADLGLDTVVAILNENLDIQIDKISNKNYKLSASAKNPYLDSYIKLKAVDLAGNETEFEKYLPGYTIDFNLIERLADSTMAFDFGNKMIGIRHCDSIKLTNYGKYEIVFDEVRLSSNTWFSLPPSQLPVTLQPGNNLNLQICYMSIKSETENHTDTLNFNFNCLDRKVVLLANPDSLKFDGGSKCDIPLAFDVSEVPKEAFVGSVYPNPSGGNISVDFGNSDVSSISIRIFDQLGTTQKEMFFADLKAGSHKISMNLSNLENGYYNLIMKIGNEIYTRGIVIVK